MPVIVESEALSMIRVYIVAGLVLLTLLLVFLFEGIGLIVGLAILMLYLAGWLSRRFL